MGYLVAQLEDCYNQNSFSEFTAEDIKGNSRVRASENPILHKSNENSGKLAKSLQQSRKRLLKKNVCILIKTASKFELAPFSSPLSSSVIALETKSPRVMVQPSSPAAMREWCRSSPQAPFLVRSSCLAWLAVHVSPQFILFDLT